MIQEPRKTYSRAFKLEAIRLAEQSDRTATQVAKELLGCERTISTSRRSRLNGIRKKLFSVKAGKPMTKPPSSAGDIRS